MPVRLPNGVTVVNVTPHDFVFYEDGWIEPITVPTDEVINAMPITENIKKGTGYHFVHVTYHKTDEGIEIIKEIRENHPDAVIVGSIIAAQAYPGEVVAPTPYKSTRYDKSMRLVKPNRFTVFPKETN
jgi:hypothetical protein